MAMSSLPWCLTSETSEKIQLCSGPAAPFSCAPWFSLCPKFLCFFLALYSASCCFSKPRVTAVLSHRPRCATQHWTIPPSGTKRS